MSEGKVNWLNILHFYQPPFQDMDIVRRVTEECYLPVTTLFLKNHRAKSIVNINGCLLELLNKFQAGKEVIENLKSLISLGQLEITGTGKYHPVFPLINTKEIKIQLLRQEMSLNSILGKQESPTVLFLPELAYWPEQTLIFKEQGYRWIIIDEISVSSSRRFMGTSLLKEKGGNINLIVRERDLSESLGNIPWRKYDIQSPDEFLQHARERAGGQGFIVTVSDAEVFGHHQKNRWKLLADIYRHPSVNSILTKNVAAQYEAKEVDSVPASWSTTREDLAGEIYFPLWHHPRNRLHRLMWQLLDLTMDEARSNGSELQNKKMEQLFSSCPFFWASCTPWWNGIMVENAADRMLNLLSDIKLCPDKVMSKAKTLRDGIYDEVSSLNKSGKAKMLQNEFLAKKKINRRDLHHLLN